MDYVKDKRVTTEDDLIKIDLQRWLLRILSYWWLFIISMGIAAFFGHRYVKNAVPLYSTNAILLIKDAGRGGGISEEQILLTDNLLGGGKSMDNEIQIMKSLTIMEKVVEKLNANVEYYSYVGDRDQKTEVYTDSPIVLDSFSFNQDYPYGVGFLVEILDSTRLKLRNTHDEAGKEFPIGKFFNSDFGLMKISIREGMIATSGHFHIKIRPKTIVAFGFKGRIKVERVGSQTASSILNIKMTDIVPKRARDVVNALIDVYNEEEISDKNRVLLSTMDFIDERVGILTGELNSVEGGIQEFKSANEIITTDAASSKGFVMGEIRGEMKQLAELEVEKEILNSLETLVNNQANLIPANLTAENPVLGSLVTQYNNSFLEAERIAKSASPENPTRIVLDKKLIDLRNLILETLRNLQLDLSIPIRRKESKISELQKNLVGVPSIDKKLVEQMRMQSIKENLFLFLLRKREETALSEAVTAANTRIVDPARTPQFPVFPKPRMVYMAAAALGFIIPLILVTLLGFFETKIRDEETISRLTSIPILGRISLSKSKEDIVIKKGTRTAIAEMFRLLRTNLNYLNVSREKQVLLITSSVSGEGKSFVGLNLAMTIALSNKKVILLGLDLRKPKMHRYLGVDNTKGITNFLIRQSELDDVIEVSTKNKNLSFITSGPSPPNPSELILSDRMDELINQLKERYDYIILDSPPIGLVSDALLLRKYVSNILLVVRHKYTKKAMVRDLENLYVNGELKGAGLVFNGVKMGRSYYGYGGYNYGYGQGYYVEEK